MVSGVLFVATTGTKPTLMWLADNSLAMGILVFPILILFRYQRERERERERDAHVLAHSCIGSLADCLHYYVHDF